jgi:hypothetical protein
MSKTKTKKSVKRPVKVLGASELATATGGDGLSPLKNPAGLALDRTSCPIEDADNNARAIQWNTAHHIGAANGGNFTAADGQYFPIYRYMFANGIQCAPWQMPRPHTAG